jgi:hypothetical protein
MSFDLFFGCFENGQEATFPRDLLETEFGPYILRREATCLILDFGANGQSLLYCDQTDHLHGFTINRPCVAPELFRAAFALLRRATLVLMVPGNCPPLVGLPEHSSHVPASMAAALGPPAVLNSPEEILDWIKQA